MEILRIKMDIISQIDSQSELPLARRVSRSDYCFLEPRIRDTDGVWVAYAGRETCAPDYRVCRTRFRSYSLELVVEGAGQAVLGGKVHELSPGAVFTYGPGIPHDITTDPEAPMVKYFVSFFGNGATALMDRAGLPPGSTARSSDTARLRGLFDDLLEEGTLLRNPSAEICANYLNLLLLKANASTQEPPSPTPGEQVFTRALKLIDGRYRELRSLQDIADQLNLRCPYLCRLFRQMDYPSPFKYLTRRKLAYAAEALVSGGKSIKQIACEVGYEDPYHFSRVFRNHYGCSPKHFAALKMR